MERTRASRRPRAIGLTVLALVATWACGETTPVDPDPPGNTAPVASAGPDQAVSATLPVSADGSASSDADGDAITYSWTLSASPAGSAAVLADATTATPSFTPDVPGTYTLQLVVNDGTDDSAPDELTVTAADNTSSQMIGAGGGTIASVDGSFELSIPAGALAADEDISMTLVPAVQQTGEVADLGEGGVVYDLQPDGLTFDVPATVTMEMPESFDATVDDAEVGVNPMIGLILSGGELAVAAAQSTTVDAETGTTTATAEIEHFSNFVMKPLTMATSGPGAGLFVIAEVPATVVRDVFFQVDLAVGSNPFAPILHTAGSATGEWADRSESPIEPEVEPQSGVLSQAFGVDELLLQDSGLWICEDLPEGVSEGVWAADVEVRVAKLNLPYNDLTNPDEVIPFRVELSRTVMCEEPQEPDFASFGAFGPEGLAWMRNPDGTENRDILLVTSSEGIVAADGSGTVLGTVVNASTPATYNRVEGIFGNGFIAALTRGFEGLILEADGSFMNRELLSSAAFSFEGSSASAATADGPQLAVPDVTANATDIIVGGTGDSQRLVGVLYGDKNIAFYIPRTTIDGEPGFVPDQSLVEAFKNDGGSVFGGESPVSAWVGPNGFDENNPMLVATIDDGIQASELKLVELVGGQASISTADVGFMDAEARTVRCLDGICAVSAWGDGITNGSMTFFAWDGQDGFTPITAQAGKKIGIGMIRRGESVLIATTNFNSNTYSVIEISLAGEVVGSTARIAPDGCTGPGHIIFRSAEEVIMTCNTSDQVVSDMHGLGS